MRTLIVRIDPKSANAFSKCMIMGAAVSTVNYNLKLRHRTIGMPVIDYDLAVLIQPMLMLGISIGIVRFRQRITKCGFGFRGDGRYFYLDAARCCSGTR